MFDIQDEQFNSTITAVEPNIKPRGNYPSDELERCYCGDPLTEIDAQENLERNEQEVLEFYCKDDYVMLTKREAALIAKHFGII